MHHAPDILNTVKPGSDATMAVSSQRDRAPSRHSWLAGVSLAARKGKVLLSLRMDSDMLEWFRAQGPGYQTRMNAVLRAYMEHTRSNG